MFTVPFNHKYLYRVGLNCLNIFEEKAVHQKIMASFYIIFFQRWRIISFCFILKILQSMVFMFKILLSKRLSAEGIRALSHGETVYGRLSARRLHWFLCIRSDESE